MKRGIVAGGVSGGARGLIGAPSAPGAGVTVRWRRAEEIEWRHADRRGPAGRGATVRVAPLDLLRPVASPSLRDAHNPDESARRPWRDEERNVAESGTSGRRGETVRSRGGRSL